MNTLGLELVWWSIQATLFSLAGLIVYFIARRRGPATGALSASTTLIVLAGVSILTLSPWPHWWTLAGPVRRSIPREEAAATEAAGSSALPVESAEFSETGVRSVGQADVIAPPMPGTSTGASVADHQGHSWEALLDEMQPDRARRADGASTWRWSGVAGLVFVGAASIALLRFLLGLWEVHRYRVCSEGIIDPLLEEQVRQIAKDMNFGHPIEVRETRRLGAPATIGWRRPLVLLPPNWKDWSGEERRVVLATRSRTSSVGTTRFGCWPKPASRLHFYHPLVHWLVRRLRLEQELAADILGAELAGGRALYLVTLTRMMLQRHTPPVAWAARPFLPNRSPFLRRIELLSENESLRHVSWTRPQMATFVAAMALLGIAIAGVRMPSGETQTLHASEPGQAVGKRDKVADRGKAPGAEAKPDKQPLTLEELRPLVVDQIRSIRSLYVAYSRTEPAEFGGQEHDYVWAEQGFKMLKYILPGESIVPYASTFDGKLTYIGGFQGDKPVRAYIEDELIPSFHESLRGNALLGWLHFGGQRDSIVDLIRSPNAVLTETPAADGTKRPTIEVKNFSRPNHFSLNAKIVLDRAHGFLPQTIAWDSVQHSDYRFSFEVDEFQQVRDGATGADRWFPKRARYTQRTAERGKQVWIENVTKLQINDVLPDDLFVLAPTTPTAAPGQEQAALAEFEKVYHLDPDQLVRRVKPPYLPGRMVNLKKWWAEAFSQSPYETSGTFLPMVYPEIDGQLGQPGFRFTSGVDQAGIPASELLNAVGAGLKLWRRDVEDPDKLLDPMVEGDFVIRADAPPDKVIAALGQLLQRECGIPVQLELRDVEHPVIVISGKIEPPFVIEPETVVELSTEASQSGEGENEQGTFGDFLKAVGRFIDPQRRIVNEVANSPYRQEKISWHSTPRTETNDTTALGESEARAAFDHLEQQTGLKFTLGTRKYPTTFMRRSE